MSTVNFQKFEHFISYFLALILLFMHLSLKMLSGIGNSEDPDPSGAV